MQLSSPALLLASLPDSERQAWLDQLSTEQQGLLRYDWSFWGRADQHEPEGEWRTWLALAGRGWGKTETGAQWIRKRVNEGAKMIALVAETQKDLEEVMVPRILRITPPEDAPEVRFKPVRLKWPTGAIAYGYNGTEPDQLRGPEFDTAWVDELAKYGKGDGKGARETWDMLKFTMRRPDPRVLVTTTPRPIQLIRDLVADKTSVVTRGTLMDNAGNLDPEYVKDIREKYEGTRLGRQEILGEIIEDVPGALWTRAMLDATRTKVGADGMPLDQAGKPVQMSRVVVAIDPSGADGEDDEGDEIGIVVAGRGVDGRGYILADRTCRLSPDGWARMAVTAYHEFSADRIVAERNFGGAMVQAVVRQADRSVPFKEVTASRGKAVRAEPVSALFEQGRMSIVGSLPSLEDQLVLMTPSGYLGEGSPDRLDAMVWSVHETMLGHIPAERPTSVSVPRLSSSMGNRR